MSVHVLAEALARVEHKLDLVLQLEQKKNPMLQLPAVGDLLHNCPVCKQQVKYIVDPVLKILIRKCGCKTGMLAPIDLEAFKPTESAGAKNGRGSEQEDGNDPGADGGSGRSSSARRR